MGSTWVVLKLALLLSLAFAQKGTPTLLALHNSHNKATTLQAVGVNGTRSILESDIINLPGVLATMKNLYDANISITVSVRYRTVPTDDIQRASQLSNFTSFAESVGPLCYSMVLGNEPEEDYDSASKNTVSNSSGLYLAVEWIRDLGRAAKVARASTNSSYRIITPEPNIRYNTVTGWNCNNGTFTQQLLAVSEDFDGSDIHLHSADAETMSKMISKVKTCTSSPLITTEWSQEPAVTSSGWLGESCVLNTSLTNLECLTAAEHTPVSKANWTLLMGTATFNHTFMGEAMQVFAAEDIPWAAYGGGFQYGQPKFDTKQLFAQLTIEHAADEDDYNLDLDALESVANEPIISWFRALSNLSAIARP